MLMRPFVRISRGQLDIIVSFPSSHSRLCPLQQHQLTAFEALVAADSIVGVTFFADAAADSFGDFRRSFISMFRITIGSVEFWFAQFPGVSDDGSNSYVGPLLFLITYVVRPRMASRTHERIRDTAVLASLSGLTVKARCA